MALTWSSNGLGVSSNPFAVDYSSPYNIPGLSDTMNQMRNDAINAYNRMQKSALDSRQQIVNSLSYDYTQAAQKQQEVENRQVQNLQATLSNITAPGDNFLGGQVSALAASGIDPSVLAAFSAAGAKSGVDDYSTTLARANKALSLQQEYLDFQSMPAVAGKSNTETFQNMIAKDLSGTYGTALSDTVGDLVGQLTNIQNARRDLQNQTNALIGAQKIADNTETAKALMGLNKADVTATQSATVQTDVSPIQTKRNQSGAALDSRGGGRYVTTAAGASSGLRI